MPGLPKKGHCALLLFTRKRKWKLGNRPKQTLEWNGNRDRDGASSTNGSRSLETRLRLERIPSTSLLSPRIW